MKIFRIANLQERCPYCGHMNPLDTIHNPDGQMQCESCDGSWNAYTSDTEPNAFKNPPPRAAYDPRGKANYTPYNP